MSSVSYIVLTNCTARKRSGGSALDLAPMAQAAGLQDAARRWKAALSAHAPRLPVRNLYVGRSISEAKRLCDYLAADLWIASAGAGLIHGDDTLAPYDVTASGDQDSLQLLLKRHGATAKDWWQALCGRNSLAELLRSRPTAMLLAALPASYVELIAGDLEGLQAPELGRVRLCTSPVGIAALPRVAAEIAMPYDDRLEAVVKFKGTRADFPQRALRHFIEVLHGHTLNQAAGRLAVTEALRSRARPVAVPRRRADDDEIKGLIRREWARTGGRCSVLLRWVRDEALLACEQGRFSQLWRTVRNEKQAE